ncbi:MAG TPA: ECF-type sigma factor [Chiayiivirga sp.]|nr:ECF-type sigma factor [Chiayiivirga sp.]
MSTDRTTELLEALARDDSAARDELFARLYDELRQCARRQRRGAQDTLSTTALVHETYLKLVSASSLPLDSRRHFMALAARAMRQILVDQARRAQSGKRGGEALHITLGEDVIEAPAEAGDVLALDQALMQLEQIDARAARVVQLHFSAGLSFGTIGALEGLNERTIKRDWEAARRVLAMAMDGNG